MLLKVDIWMLALSIRLNIVNFIGAVVFCFLGYFYEKNESKKSIAKSFIIKKKEETKPSEVVESKEENEIKQIQ